MIQNGIQVHAVLVRSDIAFTSMNLLQIIECISQITMITCPVYVNFIWWAYHPSKEFYEIRTCKDL
jgi:hypothetical protein